MRSALMTLTRLTIDPWDRSIPPLKRAIVCPLARKRTTEHWRKTLKIFSNGQKGRGQDTGKDSTHDQERDDQEQILDVKTCKQMSQGILHLWTGLDLFTGLEFHFFLLRENHTNELSPSTPQDADPDADDDDQAGDDLLDEGGHTQKV